MQQFGISELQAAFKVAEKINRATSIAKGHPLAPSNAGH
ncbi:hypothetical protein AMP9_4038 [plant metagenome]|uniref:Uncharacterized protein n=1 Tax=plant metagenome TaxID=1297885 RepID=A0A484PA29_9ZZZZ